MKIFTALIFFFLFIFSASAGVNAKADVTVKGQLIDSLLNETMPYATIKITMKDKPTIIVKALASDQSGKFDVKLKETGFYLFAFQYVGKAERVEIVEVKEDSKVIDLGKVLLKDQNGLEEVTVTAFKPLVTVDLDKVTYNTEDDPDAKTNNVFEMLKKVPMVTVDADDKIELKGSGSFKIYLDGKPSNMISNNPTQVLKSMPANTVKNIEVITDPGAKYDAEGVTGIINIVTNKQPFGGYTGSVNAGVDSRGGYNAGAYLSLKYNKIGFTGNYNYYHYRSPGNSVSSYRHDKMSSAYTYLNQNGSSEYSGNGQYGSGELSYEIDTLNLLSLSVNRYQGKGGGDANVFVKMQDIDNVLRYSYNQESTSSNTYGSTDINANYQRTFRKKDELLTASYRYSLSPDDSESATAIENIVGYKDQEMRMYSDASTKEHTFQLDYTTPFAKIHTIETGLKYIIRISESSSKHDSLDFKTNSWKEINTNNDIFKHRQDIFSGYFGYNLKLKKVGFKAGIRMENTDLNVEFPLDTDKDFGTNYFNLIPSTTVSYKFKPTQTFRLGYNMRIQRPGIWYLNPYVDNTDPRNIRMGNPDLEVEKSHNFNLNYSYFTPKINLNTNLFYNFVNNSIQRITFIEDDVNYTTYENIGKNRNVGLNVYTNWNPTKKLRINVNASGGYVDIRTNNTSGLGNSGFNGRFYSGIQYTFPKDFVVSFNGGVSSSRINLQGKSSGYHNTSLGLNKNFLNKKLTLSVTGANLFEKNRKYESILDTDQFYSKSESYYPFRQFRFGITYRFGEMKQQIQKTRRGISNDDTKQGESGNSGGGEGG